MEGDTLTFCAYPALRAVCAHQAVAAMQCLRDLHGVADPFLIVAPLSTLPHWQV